MRTYCSIIVAGLIVLLGAVAAQAEAVVKFDPAVTTQAIAISNLDVAGVLYDVEFTDLTSAMNVYGTFPGAYDFTTPTTAEEAVVAANLALTGANALSVGAEGTEGASLYGVGFQSVNVGGLDAVLYWEGTDASFDGTWTSGSMIEADTYDLGTQNWAKFTAVTAVPEPGSATLLIGLGLAGFGLVRRRRTR